MEQQQKKPITNSTIPFPCQLRIPIDENFLFRVRMALHPFPEEIGRFRRSVNFSCTEGPKRFPYQVAVYNLFYVKMSTEEVHYCKYRDGTQKGGIRK